jgi:hypothetical protein
MNGEQMHKHTRYLLAVVVALASVAGAGVASAKGGHHGMSHPARHARSAHIAQQTTAGAVDIGNVQSGDQTAPDQGSAGENESGVEQSGSEQSANDGPGGHEDEPGNSSADHQFEGQE